MMTKIKLKRRIEKLRVAAGSLSFAATQAGFGETATILRDASDGQLYEAVRTLVRESPHGPAHAPGGKSRKSPRRSGGLIAAAAALKDVWR